jgi:hypothetical protein
MSAISRPNAPLRPPRAPAAAGAPAWPTFTGTATLVGTSSSGVTVYVDQTLGAQGTQNAQDLLSSADSVVAHVIGLFEAELSECAMNGSLCGYSTGEALSRWCAAVVSSNALTDFATAPAWAQAGMPDWVKQTEQTDQDAISTGCGMAFISWLLSQGHHLSQIAQAMVALGDSGTLAALYAQLTGDAANNAWTQFQSAVQALPGGVTTDDPFNGFSQAV